MRESTVLRSWTVHSFPGKLTWMPGGCRRWLLIVCHMSRVESKLAKSSLILTTRDSNSSWQKSPYFGLILDLRDTLVIETGYSESHPQLRNDARWWYSNTDGQTKMIILIHAGKKLTWNVTVEVWEEVNVHNRRSTRRSGPSRDIRCTQRACVTNNGVVGDDIVIDFALLMRRAPRPPVEGNITLDANLLKRLR